MKLALFQISIDLSQFNHWIRNPKIDCFKNSIKVE